MKKNDSIAKMLREYRVNKERIDFLENQIRHYSPEAYSDYIESKMYAPGYEDKILKLAVVNGEESAVLNKVEETAGNYRQECDREYKKNIKCFKNEIANLQRSVYIVEDSLMAMGKSHENYRTLLERYYIQGESMEDIAEYIHISRSRCYELCKKAVEYMGNVVFGTQQEAVDE
jgi:DNA-directed RNA polymerase specialized sigma subunit